MDRDTQVGAIRRHFTRALATYDGEARAQRMICSDLMKLVADVGTSHFSHVLEIGCGTGCLTQKMRDSYEVDSWVVNDLCGAASGYVDAILRGRNYKFVEGNAEKVDLGGEFDLILSASVFQWIDSPSQFFERLSSMLTDSGHLIFSTFTPENLYEVRGVSGKGLLYPSVDELESILSCSFEIERMREDEIELRFATPMDVLRHLKSTGVTATGGNKIWTKSMQINFCDKYKEKYATADGGCHLTYRPLYVACKKKKL